MNYLAHGFRHLADPWFVAGTALPDWLRVLDRRARVPADALAPHVGAADARVASLARGALRHHEDDRAFHSSSAFAASRREVADVLRAVLDESDGHRPSFVSHLVVEVQLDASIAAAAPRLLDDYYAALASLAPDDVESAARALAPSSPAGLARIVRRFVDERFLADYADPAATVRRLDRVVRGVGQPGLPDELASAMPAARACVEARRDELLTSANQDASSAVMLWTERVR